MVQIPVGYAHVCLFFTGTGVPTGGCCTFGVDNNGSLTAAALAQQIDATAVTANLRQSWGLNATLSTIRVKLGPNDTGPAADHATNLVGTLGTSGHPGAAFLVKKNTAIGGRQGRGRLYLPAVAEADCGADGTLLPANVLQVTQRWEAFRAGMDLAGSPLVLLHGNSLSPSVITSFAASGQVATQRRRNRR